MTRLLSGVAAVAFMVSGAALAQTYPPAPPPPLAPPVVAAPPAAPGTTVIVPKADGGLRATTTQHGVDMNGNPVTHKDIYKEGVAGSSETHSTTTTDPWGNKTTTTTKVNPQ